MADDIAITPGSGAVVRTKDRGGLGVETQIVIIDKSGGANENLGLCGAKTFSAPAPTNVAASVLAANNSRKVAVIHNAGSVTVYLGPSTVTTTSGVPLGPGATLVDDHSIDAWFGITASGTGDLRIYEVA